MVGRNVIVGLGVPVGGIPYPFFTVDAAGIRLAETLYGKGSEVARMVVEAIHEEAAMEFGRLLGPILEDLFQ